MRRTHPPLKSFPVNGFTLLEILIAILIIAVGMAALANLQGKLVRYGAVAKQRTLAVNLAEEQIETMRSFYTMAETGADSCALEQTGYDDIANCVAGVTTNVGNMPFDLSWSVTPFVQNADGTTEVFTPESNRLRPDLKVVTIRAEWQDGQGATQHAELVDIVEATSIFNSGRVMARVDSNIPPLVPFEEEDFPGVVKIAIGSQKIKGSTTPQPKIVNKGNNVITAFDAVTFLQSSPGAYLERREEFKVVNCICTMDSGTGTGREPTVWNGEEYALGDLVQKRTGSVSSDEAGQPEACEMCCNDHHDASAAAHSYDNFRPAFSGDAGGFDFLGDHAHYRIENGAKVLAAEGNDYIEACRYIRKDGIFRLTTDMSIENLDVVKETYPVYFNTTYSTSVIDFVTGFSQQISVPDYPYIVPDGSYSSSALGIFLGNAGTTVKAQSRGIYVDYMTPELLKKIKCLQADGYGTYSDFCDTLKDPTWLEILPFYDVDVTSLAHWNKGSPAITVTNSPISDIASSTFSRGKVGVAQAHWDVLSNVSASIEHSNTGLTDTNPIDPDDEFEEVDNIPVLLQLGGTPPAAGVLVLGNINAGSNKVNVETVRLRQNPPDVPCEIITIVDGNSTQKTYVCDLYPAPVTGTVTVSDYNGLKVTGSTSTVLNRKVCVSGSGYTGMQVLDDGVMANPDLYIPGERTVLSFSNLAVNATVNILIVEEATACP